MAESMFQTFIDLMGKAGYLGIAIMMFLESLFPVFSSELILSSAGYSAGQGRLNLIGVIAAGTIGSLAGAVFWYGVARRIGYVRLKRWVGRHGRWLTIRPRDLERLNRYFDTHSRSVVLFGRLFPPVGTLICIPAGFAAMRVPRFVLFVTVGTALWVTLLTMAGYYLQGFHDRIVAWLDPLAAIVLTVLVLTYLYRVVTWRCDDA